MISSVIGQLFGVNDQYSAWSLIALLPIFVMVMAALYGQVTVNDMVVARYTADAWRGRVYAVRYFLIFVSAGARLRACTRSTSYLAMTSPRRSILRRMTSGFLESTGRVTCVPPCRSMTAAISGVAASGSR